MSRWNGRSFLAALSGFALLAFSAAAGADSRPSGGSRSAPSSHSAPRSSGRSSSSHHGSGGGSHHDGGHHSGGGGHRWGWGGGFYGPWWAWGGYYGYPYGYDGYYGYGRPYARYGYGYGYGGASRFEAVKTDVEPDEAALYLDGKLIGTADDFDGYPDMLYLGRGHYRLEFRLEGYETLATEVDASPGREVKIDNHLRKIPGAKHYGTYEPAEPTGPIVRYFEKRRSSQRRGDATWRDRDSRSVRPPDPGDRGTDVDEEIVDGGMAPDDDRDGADVRDDDAEPMDESAVPAPPARGLPEAPEASAEARSVFDVSPPDAAIYVDDRFAGSARELNGLTGGLAVPAGEHRITVTCPGYREATLRVRSSDSENGKAHVDLKR